MEICGKDQQNKHCSIEISKTTCAAEYKRKENCGCEFIKPVSGFECHLCNVFIRNWNDIEDHISSCQHKTIYEIHLQNHVQHQTCAKRNHTNIIGESTEDDLTINQNHGIKEFDTARSHSKRHSILDGSHGRESYPGVRNTDNVAEDHFGESDSDQRASHPSERYNTLIDEEEKQSRFEGSQVKIEDTNVDNTDLDERVPITELHKSRNYPCDVIKTSFQGVQEGAYTAIKTEQEDDDDADDYNDFDDKNGIIGGFLEDSEDDLHNHDEHYKGEIMPGYTIDNNLKTESIGQEFGHVLTSGANSSSIAKETCTATTSMSDNRWPASISENTQNHGIDETSEADNGEKTSTTDEELNVASEANGDLDVSTCEEPQSLIKGNCERIRGKHNEDRPFLYDASEKSVNLNGNIKVHERIHTGEKPFSCNVCGKSFKFKVYLKRHERVHTGEKPFSCSICGRLFQQLSGMVTHKRIHGGEKSFSCNVCGESFIWRRDLMVHKRMHTGEEPFSCNVCGKSFRWKRNVIVHEMVHTGEKPYSCNVCGKSFSRDSNLKVHQRIHTGEKTFSCNFCGKLFKTKGHLKYHERTHR